MHIILFIIHHLGDCHLTPVKRANTVCCPCANFRQCAICRRKLRKHHFSEDDNVCRSCGKKRSTKKKCQKGDGAKQSSINGFFSEELLPVKNNDKDIEEYFQSWKNEIKETLEREIERRRSAIP